MPSFARWSAGRTTRRHLVARDETLELTALVAAAAPVPLIGATARSLARAGRLR